MDLRVEFMTRLANHERMTDLCREYGISRKTGYKYQRRFEEGGVAGLQDQSRAPVVIPHKTPPEMAEFILEERRRYPTWGPKKLKAHLERRLERRLPSPSAIGALLARHGLVQPRRKRQRHQPVPTTLRVPTQPNELWCVDYKGQFRLGDNTYCYPLTVTDQFSRYILAVEAMDAISDDGARELFVEVFRHHGLPLAMRSDNGVPFASTGVGGLTRLSVFWLRLGIARERIRPAHPQENGQHERMHRTLKFETARPARSNLLQQQERFDEFIEHFNRERPHEALAMRTPADVFAPSPRPYPAQLPEPAYPGYDDVLRVNRAGQIYIAGTGQVAISTALAGEHVGIREERDGRWLVAFASLELGHVSSDRTLRPINSAPPGG